MNDNILLKALKEINNPYLISILVLICVILVIFKKEILKVLESRAKKKKARKIKSLIHHDVFATLERAAYEVKVMRFYTDKKFDKVKSRMCYDFTYNKSISCAAFMRAIALNENLDSMKQDQLKSFIANKQNEMHKTYVKATVDLWRYKGINEEDIDHVIDLFEKFRYDVVSSFSHRIDAIFASTHHRSNFDKVLAVYDMWAMGIDLLPRDMQTTFEGLNGKFKSIKY